LSEGKRVQSFRDLVVWQKAFALCIAVYQVTARLPSEERFGLVPELRKTARSIAYNIAEGQRRSTRRDFARFLDIALGSSAELLTQLLLCEALRYVSPPASARLISDAEDVSRMLYRFKAKLLPRPDN
jgi:four helix bundle protein